MNDSVFVCGTVNNRAENGAKSSQRFIARPGLASLEQGVDPASFEQSWRHIGCEGQA